MVPLEHAAVSQLQQVPGGHLFVLQVQAVPTLGIRAALGTGAVLLPQGGSPVYLDYQADPPCVDLGVTGSACVESIPGSFTPSANARVPGNLAVIGNSMCLIAQMHASQVGFGGERFVDIATGAVTPQTDQCWYVAGWSLGIYDEHGTFHELFRRPTSRQ